jgi:predicted nuclease of predicted toxin-antitoxin system
MNFLCDVHISYSLSKHLVKLGHHSIHVNSILDKWNTKDFKISQFADENNFVLITKDSDFKDSHILKNTPKKLIRIELGNIPNLYLLEIFTKNIMRINSLHLRDSFFIIIGENKVQIID